MAIVLDFDQTITLNCPNSKLTIRGANDAFNMLQTLKDRGAELAIITAQNPSKIAAKGVEDELNHLGATLKIHNAFEIFKNTKFASDKKLIFMAQNCIDITMCFVLNITSPKLCVNF